MSLGEFGSYASIAGGGIAILSLLLRLWKRQTERATKASEFLESEMEQLRAASSKSAARIDISFHVLLEISCMRTGVRNYQFFTVVLVICSAYFQLKSYAMADTGILRTYSILSTLEEDRAVAEAYYYWASGVAGWIGVFSLCLAFLRELRVSAYEARVREMWSDRIGTYKSRID